MSQQKKQEQFDTSWMIPGALTWIDLGDSVVQSFDKGTIVSLDTGGAMVKNSKNQQQIYKLAQLLERAPSPKTQFYNGFEDMVNMEILNDAELLNNVMVRFLLDYIFTYVGPTLLVVNPFKGLPKQFDEETKKKYIKHILSDNNKSNPLAYKELEPHIFAIAAEAFRCLFENNRDQSIVISGESGAGKTENAKYCMKVLTSIGQVDKQSNEVGIEDRILGCNPILEAFGNAKTIRNNNSSRFGKFVRIIVHKKTKKIKGAEIINYLMEKSRLTSQAKNERNFHIFYHFLTAPVEELQRFQLSDGKNKTPLEYFTYLNGQNTYVAPGIDDAKLFKEIKQSIEILKMKEFYESIFVIVAAVLHLGNVRVDDKTLGDSTPCTILNLEPVVTLLKVDQIELTNCLVNKFRKDGQGFIASPLNKEACEVSRDSLAKELFDRLFNWMVIRLNQTISPESNDQNNENNYTSVGLLDIYGFEVFEKNGFEQIMINYTNEKLQQLYISYVFKEEQRIFVQEELGEFCGQIDFKDNTPVIELIDKPPNSIFSLLDDSCSIKSTDEQLLQRIRNSNKSNPLLQNPKIQSNPSFIIVHTAKDVEYTIHGFRDKNKDELSMDVSKVISKSSIPLISQLFISEMKGDKFLATKIKKEMTELMNKLNNCDVHFVRCIKPNEEKQSNQMSQNMTLKQIRYLGVLHTLKVRKESYPIRRLHQAFYKQYSDMTRNKAYSVLIKENADFRELTIKMFKDYFPQLNTSQILFGKTKIFIKQSAMNIISEEYKKIIEVKHKLARRLQKSWKIYRMKSKLKQLSKLANMFRKRAQLAKQKVLQKKQRRAVLSIEIWFAYVLKKRRVKKYKDSSKLFQMFIKRFHYIQFAARKRKAAEKIQKFARQIKFKKEQRQQMMMKKLIQNCFEDAWFIIQSKAAVKIQALFRGFLYRVKNRAQIQNIKEVSRQKKIRKQVTKIQRAGRRYIQKKRLKRLNEAAYYIQGYFRMKWLSDLFQRMRREVVKIQRRVRRFLIKRRQMHIKYDQFIRPWEDELNYQIANEKNALWETNIQSPLNAYRSISDNNSPQKYEDINTSILDQCLASWRPKLPKMCLFLFPIDLDIFCSLHLGYNSKYSYSRTLLNIIVQQMKKDHPVQSICIGAQSTICTTVGGTSIYEFGDNKMIGKQRDISSNFDDQEEGVEKILLPENIRIKSVQIAEQHMLLITHDDTLIQYGDPTSVLQKSFVHNIKANMATASCNITFAVSQDKKLYTWPVMVNNQLIRNPLYVSVNHKVKTVTSGNQFAIILCEGGQLYSWGENLEGELGVGDTQMRNDPTLITIVNDKIAQISCGFKHACCRSTLNKLYTWGWGEKGQLGTNDYRNELSPRQLQLGCGIFWASCGRTSTFIITDQKQVFWTGTNSSIDYQCSFEPFRLELRVKYIGNIILKSQVLYQQQFVPVRVISTWSKTMELTYITFANCFNCLEENANKRNKIINKLIQNWSESSDPYSVDPPYNQTISNYIYEASMRKPSKNLIKNTIYSYVKSQQELQQYEQQKKWQPRKKELLTQLEIGKQQQALQVIPEQINKDNQFPRFSFTNISNNYASQISQIKKQNKGKLEEIIEQPSVAQSQRQIDERQYQQQVYSKQFIRTKKLMKIKRKVIELQEQGENKWSQGDAEFIQAILNSKVSELIQAIQL